MNKIKISKAILLSLFAIFVVAAFFILPSGDDWWSIRSSSAWNWRLFLPHYEYGYVVAAGLWRPIPVLIGNILGYFPQLFPFVYHFLTIVFYILSAFMVDKICKILEINEKTRLIVLAFMLFAPVSMATFLSIDAYGQSAASFFGLWSVVAFYKNHGFRRYFKWLLLVFIGTFFKESGLAWLVATPVFVHILEKNNVLFDKKLIRHVLVGSCLAVLYLIARQVLMQENHSMIVVEDEMSLSPINITKNILLIVGSCLTTADTLAWFLKPQNYTVLIITTVLGIPMLIYFVRMFIAAIKNKKSRLKYLLFCFLIICVTSPHVIITGCAEMYSYATIPIIAIMAACLFKDTDNHNIRFIKIAIATYFAAALFVDAHKYVTMYNSGLKGRDMALKIDGLTQKYPHNVLILNVLSDETHYSVYKHPVFIAYGRGYATLALNDFKYPKHICYRYVNQEDNYDSIINSLCEYYNNIHFDNIWILDRDNVTIVKSEEVK